MYCLRDQERTLNWILGTGGRGTPQRLSLPFLGRVGLWVGRLTFEKGGTLVVIHARAKKLGDALIVAKTIADFQRFSADSLPLKTELLVVLPRELATAVTFHLRATPVFYRGEFHLSLLGLWLRLASQLARKQVVVVNITGESGASKALRSLLSPAVWATRTKDFSSSSRFGVHDRLPFKHTSQFEYCEGPLRLLYPDFRASRCLSVRPERSLRVVKKQFRVLIAPFSAENRRTVGLRALSRVLRSFEATDRVCLMFNPRERLQREFVNKFLKTLPTSSNLIVASLGTEYEVWRALRRSEELICADSGVYVLASLIGMPVTVLYGPTQPGKTRYNLSSPAVVIRDSRLGDKHCEVIECQRSWCIDSALSLPVESANLPGGCLLSACA
ncbi:MAG: hypothetical protein EB068_01135 [Betaproteobacteria bacterium]|nr:hypothetical protein [Betaproteobacteria bacterium]